MARPGITYADVRSAADELLKSGISPSIQRIREYLGTGSNTTIAGYLKQWQQDLLDQPKTILPPAVPEELMGAIEQCWQLALEKSEAAYQEVKATAERTVEQAEQERDQAVAKMQLIKDDADILRQELKETRLQLAEAEKSLLIEQERRDLAETEIESAEQRAAEAWQSAEKIRLESRQQITQLEKIIAANREESQQRLIEAEQRLKHERERGEASESRLLQLIDKLRNEQRDERTGFASERSNWKTKEEQLLQRQEKLQTEAVELRSAFSSSEEKNRNLNVQHRKEQEQSHDRLATLEKRQIETAKENNALLNQIEMKKYRAEELEKELADYRIMIRNWSASSANTADDDAPKN